ncbi:hypothetical protein [Streptomyces sp. NBC_01089]|uniref:hypothetical protein n=1 Tax=Streptomyces sp. NBC_01089 TaxID=2903747 RepID=UPI003866DCE8|nr:hypothetical protein OG510_10245 [Streptomyces sp. NBC_01089]
MNATTKTDTTDDSAAKVQDAEADEAAAEATAEDTDTDIDADDATAEAAAEEEAAEAELAGGSPAAARSGIGTGAAAVVAAALGFVGLSGSWMGKVLSERETLTGQLKLSQSASASQQIHEVYADSWHTTALVNGVFALLALVVGALVLARPFFSSPVRPQAVWVRAVAWGAVGVAVIGLIVAVGMYFDLFAALPTAPATAPAPTQ